MALAQNIGFSQPSFSRPGYGPAFARSTCEPFTGRKSKFAASRIWDDTFCPKTFGLSFDVTGSYTRAFVGFAALFVVAVIGLTQMRMLEPEAADSGDVAV